MFPIRCDAVVLSQAVPLALAGAIYPVAFAAIVALLGGPDPLRRSIAFLFGGTLVSVVGFAVVVFAASESHFTPPHHPAVAAAIKVVLGVLLLALAARTLLKRRRDGPAALAGKVDEDDKADTGSTRRAFITGMLVYIPGIFLIASAKAVADADASVVATVVASILCVVALLVIVELPIVAYAIARDRVQPPLERATVLGKTHSKRIILVIELLGGLYLLIAGLATLV